jgi:hypothetical protein
MGIDKLECVTMFDDEAMPPRIVAELDGRLIV